MWTLGEDAIALSHADATSVFVALKPGESSFEEAIDGAGLVTNEPAVACGAWWSGNVVASWTQITPRRARLCADGALLSEWRPDRDAGCVDGRTARANRPQEYFRRSQKTPGRLETTETDA